VWHTVDGGLDCWPESDLPGPPNGQCASRITDVACAGARAGIPVFWIVGKGALFWRSLDGGKTWSSANVQGVPPAFEASAIAFDTLDRAFVVGRLGAAGLALRIDDAMAAIPTAHDVTPPFAVGRLHGVAVLGAEAYAVGQAGVVLRYDASATPPSFGYAPGAYEWVGGALVQATTHTLYAVAMAGDAGGHLTLVAGERGTVLEERDGSGTWSLVPSRTTDVISSLQLLSPRLGWMVGLNADPHILGPHTPTGWGDSTIVTWR
jgi:photosystem II stability/assembly factor-like uncharacterized protein